MVASRRERIIGLLTASVLAVLALDRVVVSPLMARRADVGEQVEAARIELQEADALFTRGVRLERDWNEMLAGGLKSDVPAAEGQALRAMEGWAREAGVTVRGMAPARVETQQHFRVSTIRGSIAGSMRTLGEFLWRIQTADIPIRVVDITISANKDGTDDLTLQLGVSTLSLAPETTLTPGGSARPGNPVASAAQAGTSFNREATR